MVLNEDLKKYGEIGKIISIFQEINKIPRNSGNELAIVKYLENFAQKRNLRVYTDAHNNVIIKKLATNGQYDNYIAFQSHTDMVCEKLPDSNHDFINDPIDLFIKDDYILSNETNIGADNGIGVAYMLAMLDSSDIKHPNLEMIFTAEEETSMNGAKNIDLSQIESNRIISLDAFSENVIIYGCASNLSRVLCFSGSQCDIPELKNKKTYSLNIDGFQRRTFW